MVSRKAQKRNRFDHHVSFCTGNDPVIGRGGRAAELATAELIVENLFQAGDYRILMNYNLMQRGPGAGSPLEIDAVVINRNGVFLLEVKDWRGMIEAYNDVWLDNGRKRPNPITSIQHKARVFSATFFGSQGELRNVTQCSVTGLVVLHRGRHRFNDYGSPEYGKFVLDRGELIHALRSTQLLHYGSRSRQLDDPTIRRVTDAIHGKYAARREHVVGHYRILGELSAGDLFDAYEAQNITLPALHVRLKRYQLPSLTRRVEENMRLFRRSAEALSELRFHRNIVGTLDFFVDSERPDVFYEVTELSDGQRLDEIISLCQNPLSLKEQRFYLESICEALVLSHNHKRAGKHSPIYHRNICPETVFVTNNGVVKLADFDFAKISGSRTISIFGETLVDTKFTAPELLINSSSASAVSDIYSLGALWYCLAKAPGQVTAIDPEQIKTMDLPETARSLMKKMLAKAPNSRPESAEYFLERISSLR